MERFSFAQEAAFVPRGDLLDHVSLAPLTPSTAEGALVQAVILRFEPGGRLRRNPAGSPQTPCRTRGIRRSERGDWCR